MSGLSYVMTFVTITILLSADFWLVKNVSGRLLAGLRWWNVVDETSGNQVSWKFESWTSEDRQLASKSQSEFIIFNVNSNDLHLTATENCFRKIFFSPTSLKLRYYEFQDNSWLTKSQCFRHFSFFLNWNLLSTETETTICHSSKNKPQIDLCCLKRNKIQIMYCSSM